MELKCRTVKEVDAFDLRAFTEHHLGRAYEVEVEEEMSNDSATTARADVWPDDPEDYMTKFEKPDVDQWLDGGTGRVNLRAILSELASRGLIEPGDYAVAVSW